MPPATELRVRVGETTGDVSALLVRPADARLLYVLAHGAGAGMRHPFLETISQRLAGVRGLVFLGFPLHPPGRPGNERAEHLTQVQIPMLFLQGTRDDFADLKLLRPVVKRLGTRATLHLVDGGDHSFKVLKKPGRTEADVMTELVGAIVEWAAGIV